MNTPGRLGRPNNTAIRSYEESSFVKRISPATVTFGVMAVVLGLVAAYIVRQNMQPAPVVEKPAPPPPPAPPAPEMVAVVFARYNIPKHTRITPADIFVGMVPKEAKAAQGTYRGTTQAEGRITKEIVRAGQAIREDYLLPLGEALPDLAERLPAGHRAVTITVQGADTGGKRLSEGDHIDIAMTVEGTHPDLGEVTTRTLMRNVLIVDAAADRPIMRGTKRMPDMGSQITVAVVPADANKLIVAQRTGMLQATLVSAQEAVAADPTADDTVNRRQLLGLKEIVPPKKFTIEKWSGSSVRFIEMSDDRVQESRAVSAGATPVAKPAPKAGEVSLDQPSGAILPTFATSFEEPAEAAIEPAAAIK